MAGLVLVIVGVAVLARQMGVDLPYWLFTWPMILVGIGIYVGARHGFRPGGWLILVLLGGLFLSGDILYDINMRRYFWPAVIIGIGLYMIFRPRRSGGKFWEPQNISSEDMVEATSIFGGSKKNIISKDFKGGEISTIFGGTDLNFGQADINGTATINITTVFGGTKLIVPSHWNLRSDVDCIFGGLDDKRHLSKDSTTDMSKTLVLKGIVIFGGIDIKSY